MSAISLLPSFVRELVCRRTLPREPEPDLIMERDEQVEAYAAAARDGSAMSAVCLFNSAHISLVLGGSETVVDLGCGPCTQLAQFAELNPRVSFVGVDLSKTMLESARAHIDERGIRNISLMADDITRLSNIADNSVDAVMSTMSLHHLRSFADLRSCFKQIKRILKPSGALYLLDFTRLKSLKTIIKVAYLEREFQPHIYLLDYERSLRAAFLYEELKTLASEELPTNLEVISTFLVPLLGVVKSPDCKLTEAQIACLRALRTGLPKRFRRDLDDLRRFFRLGGLADPFG